MRRFAILLALGLLLVPAAQASGLAYRTKTQAQDYLEHTLKTWGGINLTTKKYKFRVAFCLPGSARRTRRHTGTSPCARTGRANTSTTPFACTLAAADKLWHLYVVAERNGRFGLRNEKQR